MEKKEPKVLTSQPSNLEVLNAVQQTLRSVVIALALESKADMNRLSTALAAWASNPAIEPHASSMLEDLASGVGFLAGTGKPRS